MNARWHLLVTAGLAACNSQGTQIDEISPDGGADAAAIENSPGCEADEAALVTEMYSALAATCSVVIRLDHDTRAIEGYQLFCGNYMGGTEALARSLADADTGFGASGVTLNSDPWVFLELHSTPASPSGVAVFGATVGRTVFGGSMLMGGTGDITYPSTWRAPTTLSTGCAPTGDIYQRIGYDLDTSSALSTADIDAAIEVVRGTAIPAAMWRGGYVFNGIVLRYPRAIEPFDATTAEWIVVLTGGWLE